MEMASTQIRMKTNPITDGIAKFKPAPDQAVISPTGSMVTHWFWKVLGNPDLGSVCFMNILVYANKCTKVLTLSLLFRFQVALAPNLLILRKQVSGLCKSDCGNL